MTKAAASTEPAHRPGSGTSPKGDFSRFSARTAKTVGSPLAFVVAVLVVAGWAVTGPFFHFSDTWQLVINTSTTIVTFLMVFVIQNTQNRDTAALQIKLDEVIRCLRGAHNSLIDLEGLSVQELEALRKRYASLAEEAHRRIRGGKPDTGTPDLPKLK
jgi:low affinity Fe/Cu permease